MKNFKLLIICALTLIIGILAGCASMTLVDLDWDNVSGPAQVRQGQNINPRDVIIYGFYKDGSRKLVGVNASDITFNKSTPGVQTVNVRVGFFNQQAAQFTTEVMALERLTVASPPRNVIFKQGQDPDRSWPGLEIRGEWNQMGSEKIDISYFEITGYDKNQPGRQTITATYEGLAANFQVEVKAMTLRIVQPPTKAEYLQGETLDLTGLRVNGVWEGLPEEELRIVASDVTGYNPNTIGNQNLTITKDGATVRFTVNTLGLTSISISVFPTKRDYVFGEEIDLTGIEVIGNYTGSSTTQSRSAAIPRDRLVVSNYNPNLISQQTVRIQVSGAANGVFATFPVTVTLPPPAPAAN